MVDALGALLRSRKFMVLILDVVVSLVLFFVGKYAIPSAFEDVKFVVLGLQPVALAVIAGIAYEDGQAKRNGTFFTEQG